MKLMRVLWTPEMDTQAIFFRDHETMTSDICPQQDVPYSFDPQCPPAQMIGCGVTVELIPNFRCTNWNFLRWDKVETPHQCIWKFDVDSEETTDNYDPTAHDRHSTVEI